MGEVTALRGPGRALVPRRVAVLSLHTSPLELPGTGDAGGMNVYVMQTALRLARRGIEVEVFTRATASDLPPVVEAAPGVLVRHVMAGPFEDLRKEELPAQLCAFAAGVLRVEAQREPGYFDLLHSHYWLSGQVGWLAKERMGAPLVHTAHTLAKVKNAAMAEGDTPEPRVRVIGEEQVVAASDRLVANTAFEFDQLVSLYGARPEAVATVPPGVDLDVFVPGDSGQARRRLDVAEDAVVLTFVGRIQPLKAPDVLVRAAARLLAEEPSLRDRLVVLIVGGPSGTGLEQPEALQKLAAELGIGDVVRFLSPRSGPSLAEVYRASDAVAVPSHNESFGLVALEAQACGTPVVAAAVGGLPVAVADGRSGRLVHTHDPSDWARALRAVALAPGAGEELAAGAVRHARRFSWDSTTDELISTYREATSAFGADGARRIGREDRTG
ncbi:D-inositol-3-phosphate glycosyltransferase [Actinoalloteichus hymeniacidonis]|uniref:D-inositol-3-phosphate glycosyltransferase n=1 Tax=Actinoalloteichus hymeniacidonis TaxID=340345 RepID=A0AAC9HL93_9PSEU|nr:D-inositol-3-phosphate glycosyltransferase [Actinoalloteichus hymeniacidonis]AOS61294.1 D-inositol-3-phosphate glycosyltransferase [Actinoalloteichus hymeniacidonis]MBB5910702.1 D-inositol-3-phosphate glycosyltransferase [Actinoalloteichus hymeniacidonis]